MFLQKKKVLDEKKCKQKIMENKIKFRMRKKTGSYNESTIGNRISLQKMIRIQMKEQLKLKKTNVYFDSMVNL